MPTLKAKINEVKNKIPSITNLATTAALNAKINEAKNKMPNITNLATNTALTDVQNKISNHNNYIITPEFNKLTTENFTTRIKLANLAIKGDIADFVKKTDFDDKLKNLNKKVTWNKSKHLLVENELKKPRTYNLSLFIGQSYFFNDGEQLYLKFQPRYYTLKRLGDTEKVVPSKSKGLSAEKRTTPTTNDDILSPSVKWYRDSNFCLTFKGSYLKQKNATFTPPNKIIYFIFYEFNTWSWDLNSNFTLNHCLFGGVKLAKNADPDEYRI